MLLALSAWLKQIIVIALVAAFLDVLLPASALQKYVRMVMGLVIVLAMLSPLLSVFRSGVDPVDAILSSVLQNNSVPTLSDISTQTARIQASESSQTNLYFKAHLATLLKDEIRRMYDVQASSIVVTTQDAAQGEAPVVTAVDVDLASTEASASADSGIQPMGPITLNRGASDKASGSGSKPALTPEQSQTAKEVQSLIAQELTISPTSVHVRFEASGTASGSS